MLVEFNVVYHKTKNEIVTSREWCKYSKEVLNENSVVLIEKLILIICARILECI